jgi:DNA-binding GntR family transcriptional regulator
VRADLAPEAIRIAPLRELEREFGVARLTLRHAIDLLQGTGLAQSFRRRGILLITRARSSTAKLSLLLAGLERA